MKTKNVAAVITIAVQILSFAHGLRAAEEIPPEMSVSTENIMIKNQKVLEPASLNAKLGTTVVWINTSAFPVEIIFLGKKVALACGSPMNFSIDKDGAFHSAIIPRGGTASICFIEKGTYTYKLESSGMLTLEYGKQERKESRGTIVIE
jgi:plastocyanin